jgi:hypothetical protein
MKINTILIAMLCFAMIACDNEKKEQQKLYDQVMESHDLVMPEMGTLIKLSKRLKERADSLATSSDLSGEDAQDEIMALSKALDDANESMMQWMRDFEPAKAGTPHEEVMEYLTEQKKQIDKVREDMFSAKDNAEKYFSEN